MKILIIGLGVIGTTYAYVLKNAEHTVEHYVRPDSVDVSTSRLTVDLLDGRKNSQGYLTHGSYDISLARKPCRYDMIIMSLSSLHLEDAVKTLNDNGFVGPVVLLCGIWEDRSFIAQAMGKQEYVLGYPVAGGAIDRDKKYLDCVLFDHVMLEDRHKASTASYDTVIKAFKSADLKVECPYDMLEWIWVHMGINAAVISTAASVADTAIPTKAAEKLMDSVRALRKAIIAIRECLYIIKSRGVDLRHYRRELLPYALPSWLSAVIMKQMFAKNQLTRRIMLLHTNMPDLVYICGSVYQQGKFAHTKAPLFYNNYETYLLKFENKEVTSTIS
jgi:ketopantoate reductase